MKRVLPLSLIAVTVLFSSSINIHSGWNLAGAIDSINPNSFDKNCIKTVWVYDENNPKKWKLYQTIDSTHNFGFDYITDIAKGQGFWVKANCNTNIDFDNYAGEVSNFDLYGLHWSNVKRDARYTVQGNKVEVYGNTVSLHAVKADNKQSRAEIKAYLNNNINKIDADVKLTDIGNSNENYKYTFMNVKVSFDVNIQDDNDSNLIYRNAEAGVTIKGKAIYAWIGLYDADWNHEKDIIQPIYPFNENNQIIMGKNLHVEITREGNVIHFKTTDGYQGDTTIDLPNNQADISGFRNIKIGLRIKDDKANMANEEASSFVSGEVYNVVATANNIMQTQDATTLTWNDFANVTNIFDIEKGDNSWYDKWDLNLTNNSGNFYIVGYEYENNSWQQDDTHSGTLIKNSDTNISLTETNEGFKADLIIKGTKQITSIGNMAFNDLYATDIEFHVTDPGRGWSDTWDWENPSYWTHDDNGDVEHNITTNSQLKEAFLLGNNWFDSDYHAMIVGNISDNSGNVVEGVFAGYHHNCNSGDCKKYEKGSNVVGSWSYSDTNGISIDLPNKKLTLYVSGDCGDLDTHYCIKEDGQDKVGAVWKETLITGSDANDTIIQNILRGN